MNDAERAERLARAIDGLLHGGGQDQVPDTFDDEELNSLRRTAELRASAGDEKRRSSAEHEAAIWQRLTQRLKDTCADTPYGQPDHAEEVVEAIATRRPLYQDESGNSDDTTEVWQRVRQRLDPHEATPETPASKGPPSFPLGKPQADGVVRAALAGPTSGRAMARNSHVQEQLRGRMRGDTLRTTIDDLTASQCEPGFLSQITLKLGGLAAAATSWLRRCGRCR